MICFFVSIASIWLGSILIKGKRRVKMGKTIESGYLEAREEPNWSPLYFFLVIVCGAMIIVPILYLALADAPSSTDRWMAVVAVVPFLVLGGLICGAGISEYGKEVRRECKPSA